MSGALATEFAPVRVVSDRMSMPAIFFGHGSPMNAIEVNPFTRAWRTLAKELPRPRAVLAISAHWYLPGTHVTAMEQPRTIHDFGGFPRELYDVEYPAPGDPQLAQRIGALLAPASVGMDRVWGLDHGTWSVLTHVYPEADIPVLQLSLDAHLDAPHHYALAQRLAPLRDEGVLILGSGNIVHNLRELAWDHPEKPPFDWAASFEGFAREMMIEHRDAPLIDYASREDGRRSAPTPEHYLPLLYVLAQRTPGEPISFPVEGTMGGSISMLAVKIG